MHTLLHAWFLSCLNPRDTNRVVSLAAALIYVLPSSQPTAPLLSPASGQTQSYSCSWLPRFLPYLLATLAQCLSGIMHRHVPRQCAWVLTSARWHPVHLGPCDPWSSSSSWMRFLHTWMHRVRIPLTQENSYKCSLIRSEDKQQQPGPGHGWSTVLSLSHSCIWAPLIPFPQYLLVLFPSPNTFIPHFFFALGSSFKYPVLSLVQS